MESTKPSYFIERYQNGQLIGWIYDESKPNEAVSAELYINNEKADIDTVVASEYRQDLEHAGMGNGKHCFVAKIRDLVEKDDDYVFSFKDNQGEDLTGNPFALRVQRDNTPRRFENNELMAELVEAERQRLTQALYQEIDSSVDSSSQLDAVCNVFLSNMAKLQVKASTLESVVANRSLKQPGKPHGLFSPEAQKHVVRLSDSVVIDASQVAPEDNYYGLEHSEDGKPYRWTGPDAVNTFTLSVSRSEDKPLELRLLNSVTPEALDSLKLVADGNELKSERQYKDNAIVITAVLPKSSGNKPTKLEMKLDGVTSPAQLGGSQDQRLLGVAFNQVKAG